MHLIALLNYHNHANVILILVEVLLLIIASAICSGLNIAIMSLDLGELKRKVKLGNPQAKKVIALRKQSHLTLASILLTNVATVSATTLVLNQLLTSWLAGLVATLLIVIFGEILPQSLFSRQPLFWTSFFAPILKLMIYLTYIISRPLAMLLDRLFPRLPTKLQSRHELGLLISEHLFDKSSELDDNELEIMRGALQLSEKRVRDIMTDLQHTYWLTTDTCLNDEKIEEVKVRGFSRIPIFDDHLTKCYGVLLMKDLVDIDFDEQKLYVRDMNLHPTTLIGSMTALDTLFKKFISAGSHLMPIEKDDLIIGIVTIEDLIEEIFGQEIEDETDRKRLKESVIV